MNARKTPATQRSLSVRSPGSCAWTRGRMAEAPRFSIKGYDIVVEPAGLATWSPSDGSRRRGVALTATSRHTGDSHTLSAESDVNADGHHVKLLVDGRLPAGATLFPLPKELAASMQPMINWFIDQYLD